MKTKMEKMLDGCLSDMIACARVKAKSLLLSGAVDVDSYRGMSFAWRNY